MTDSAPGPLRCALIGADTLLIECGELLLSAGHQITVVGAGSAKVADWAASRAIASVDTSGAAADWVDELATHPVEWLFAITHLAMLPPEVLAIPTRGAINFHDGPLPGYVGLNTPMWALLNGETEYGVTWHLIDAGSDTGDVVAQRRFELAPAETALSLNTRNFDAALESFEELVGRIAAGELDPRPQDRSATSRTYRRADRPAAMSLLDWRRQPDELDRLVRALTVGPYPNPLGVPKLRHRGGVLDVLAVETVELDEAHEPGTVVAIEPDRLVVACQSDAIALTSLSTDRGRPLELAEALEVLALEVGDRLPAIDDAATLDRVSSQLAAEEAEHLRQLEHLEPVELPWARTRPAQHVPGHATVDLDLAGQPEDAAVLAAFAVTLARLSDKEQFHVGLVADTWEQLADDVRVHLADAAPALLAVGRSATLADVCTHVDRVLAATRERLPFANELIARHPELARDHELAAGRLVPVSVRLAASAPSTSPASSAVVELARFEQGWQLRFDDQLVDPADVETLAGCVRTVLASVQEDPGATVASVDLLDPELRELMLVGWNDTTTAVEPTTVGRLVDEQIDRTPETTAVIFEDDAITYRELDERANRLAHHLVALGIGADALVGVHVGRSIELIVAVVAVHKAGGAYVPLDPMYPSDRLEHMIVDSGCSVVITDETHRSTLPRRDDPSITVVSIDGDAPDIDQRPSTRPQVEVGPEHLAYCIYTSGSTGLPKGVLVEHRNVVNFFAGMDERVPHELPATWFAVTSLSFDISVLELLYTLTRGFSVVVYLDRDRSEHADPSTAQQHASTPMDFSLFYFSGDAAEGRGKDKYRLLLEGARFADAHDFTAVWTPERHFHAFGGLYPQPAVTGAAVAAITEKIGIRAGSVVMPLEHPIRVAEAWSVVDNLSNGRVGISVASGWQPNDFVLRPQNYQAAKQAMFDGLEAVQRLWRGETLSFDGALDEPVTVATLPRPVQAELPSWVTTAGNPETYIQAGRIGANVLTHLLGQSIEQLAPKIAAYRAAREEAGFDPDTGVVTLMLHTFVGDDEDAVREAAREPLKSYLGESFSLLREYAWSFPAFQRPAGSSPDEGGLDDDVFRNLDADDLDAVLEFAFLRYYDTSGLFGTVERCTSIVDGLKGIGVNEIACLIDFGIDTDAVLESLPHLDRVRVECNRDVSTPAPEASGLDQSVAAQLTRHEVTHLQCTPSMARMWSLQDDARDALARVPNLFVGGEAFPVALAADLVGASHSGNVTNMYGPTETTIWSTTWPVPEGAEAISIGTPIANTQIYVLDRELRPLPPGVAGQLWIGGDGVVRGYHDRTELTAERFVEDPFRGDGARMYHTGDLARWRRQPDGSARLEFLGRIDHQVKIRGYRIELGEIEAQLGRQPGVRECVAVVREDVPGDQRLVAYASPAAGASLEPAVLKERLRETLPEVMVPALVTILDDLPHTPNGKIDRNALPAPGAVRSGGGGGAAPADATNDLERDVLAVWEEVLGRDGIGIDDNFFDIGGHSLLIVRLHRRFKETLPHPVALTELYRFPTVRSFAASLANDTSEKVRQESTDRANLRADRAALRRENMRRRRGQR